MPLVAEASLDLEVSPTVAFDTLTDHSLWPTWMPRSFLPVGASPGVLAVGQTVAVRISGMPVASTLHIDHVDRPTQVGWSGGVRGLMFGDHRFIFEANGVGTRVRSVE